MRALKRLFTLALFVLIAIVGYYGYSVYHFASEIQKVPEDSRFKQFAQGVRNDDILGGHSDGYPGGIGSSFPLVGNTGPSSGSWPAPAGQDEGVELSSSDQEEDVSEALPEWENHSRLNILLLGGDSRGLAKDEAPRSDTMMVVSVDPKAKTGHIFSILRDTYVRIPGRKSDRINAALAMGGPDLAMKTASDLLGLPISYYIYTDFQGFVELVNAVGGIDYEVEKDMKYVSKADGPEYAIRLNKGMQHMDGKAALGYVRFRHDAMSDFSRTERQRKFMQALGAKLQSSRTLIRLPHILRKVDPYIETNLTVSDMARLARLGIEMRSAPIGSDQIPPNQLVRERTIGGASVLTADRAKVREYVKQRLIGQVTAPPADKAK